MQDRPFTTLFFPISVDGRITSHDSDDIDPKSWKADPKIRASLVPFLEFSNPLIPSVSSGEAMASIGVNQRSGTPKKQNFQLIVIDDQHHLTANGIHHLSQSVQKLFLVTTANHPAIGKKLLKSNRLLTHTQSDSLEYIIFTQKLDLKKLSTSLHKKYDFTNMSVHSNARLNARWLSLGLIDQLSVILSPILVGKHGTPNLIDTDLKDVILLKLIEVKQFGVGFVNLRYKVTNTTIT